MLYNNNIIGNALPHRERNRARACRKLHTQKKFHFLSVIVFVALFYSCGVYENIMWCDWRRNKKLCNSSCLVFFSEDSSVRYVWRVGARSLADCHHDELNNNKYIYMESNKKHQRIFLLNNTNCNVAEHKCIRSRMFFKYTSIMLKKKNINV